jgi:hypothetical protein
MTSYHKSEIINFSIGLTLAKSQGAGSKAKAAEIETDSKDCFIQIPAIHPDADKYDKHPLEQR